MRVVDVNIAVKRGERRIKVRFMFLTIHNGLFPFIITKSTNPSNLTNNILILIIIY